MKPRTMTRRLVLPLKMLKLDYKALLLLTLFIVLTVLPSEAFLFNPFYLPLLAIALSYSLPTYLIVAILSTLLAFSKSLNYTLEIAFINTIFLLATLIPFKFKHGELNKYGALLLSELSLGTIYLIDSFSLNSFLTVIMTVTLSLAFFHYTNDIFKRVSGKATLKLHSIAVFSLFLPMMTLYYPNLGLLISLSSLIIFYTLESNVSKRLSFLFLEGLILVVILRFDLYLIEVLLCPFLLVFIPKSKPSLIAFSLSPILTYVLTYPTFYQNMVFLIILGSLLISYLLSDLIATFIENETMNIEIDSNNRKLERELSLLKNYLTLLQETCVRPSLSPDKNAMNVLDKELCNTCQNKEACPLRTSFIKILETKLDIETKEQIERVCLYPSKFLYRARSLKPLYERQKALYNSDESEKRKKADEIKTLLSPLENLLRIKNYEYDLLGTLRLIDESITKVTDSHNYISIWSTHKVESEPIIAKLNSLLENSYTLKSQEYSYLEHQFVTTLMLGTKYGLETEVLKISTHQPSGDSLKTTMEGARYRLLLSDGMGHEDDSYLTSSYLVDALSTTLVLKVDVVEAIKEANRLLKLKSEREDYATLDCLEINLNSLKADIYKFGSYISYLYSSSILYEYAKVGLPLGILDEFEISPTHLTLHEGDILVIASDGANVISHSELSLVFKEYRLLKDIAKRLQELLKGRIEDDVLIVLLKVFKTC